MLFAFWYMENIIHIGTLSPSFNKKEQGIFPLFEVLPVPLTQNNREIRLACLAVAYSKLLVDQVRTAIMMVNFN